MFYIIATRLPLVYSDTTNRKYLKLFVLGSIIYLCVHYYLFLEERTGLLNKVKSKLYYVMIADFAVAMVLTKFLSHRKIEEDVDDKDNKDVNENSNITNNNALKDLEEQKRKMMEAEEQRRRMFELMKQQQYQQMMQQRQEQEEKRNKERDEEKENKKKKKKKETTSSSESSESSKKEEKPTKEVVAKPDTDTELPVYE